jgi:hypothetical protein
MCSRNDLAEHLITDDTHKYYERNKPYIAWPAVLSNSGSPLTMRKKILNRFIIYIRTQIVMIMPGLGYLKPFFPLQY